MAAARARFALCVEELSVRRTLATLVERGLIRPGDGRPFVGVVIFELREAAEWAGEWVPRPVTVTDVACAICGKAAARVVVEGETVDDAPAYCATCRPEEEAETSSPEPVPLTAVSDPPADEPLRRRSLA